MSPIGRTPSEFLDEAYPAKFRGMGLLCGENCMILTSTILPDPLMWWTDRQTDRQTDRRAMAYMCYSIYDVMHKNIFPSYIWEPCATSSQYTATVKLNSKNSKINFSQKWPLKMHMPLDLLEYCTGKLMHETKINKMWCESTTNPVPCCASRHCTFLWIDPKLNQVIPWSFYTFPGNFTQIVPAVFS